MKVFMIILLLLVFNFGQGQIIKVQASNSIEANEKILMTLIDTPFHRGWDCSYDPDFEVQKNIVYHNDPNGNFQIYI